MESKQFKIAVAVAALVIGATASYFYSKRA
jgi:hypothetical protein